MLPRDRSTKKPMIFRLNDHASVLDGRTAGSSIGGSDKSGDHYGADEAALILTAGKTGEVAPCGFERRTTGSSLASPLRRSTGLCTNATPGEQSPTSSALVRTPSIDILPQRWTDLFSDLDAVF